MLHATIRRVDIKTVEVKGEGYEALAEQLNAQTPDGFDLVSAPVRMLKGETAIVATGTYARRDETREIEGATMDALRGQVPDGWQMLHVINV